MLDTAVRKPAASVSLKKQHEIFAFAENERIQLADALSHFGKSLDDLVYEKSRKQVWTGGPPRYLEDFKGSQHHVPMVSFFTGCGGIDLGFEAAGFAHVAAFEFNELFCKTLRKNRPE